MVGFSIPAEHAPAAQGHSGELRRHVVEHDHVHLVSFQCGDQVARQTDPPLEPMLGRGKRMAIEEDGHIDIALAMCGSSGVAAEQIRGHDALGVFPKELLEGLDRIAQHATSIRVTNWD